MSPAKYSNRWWDQQDKVLLPCPFCGGVATQYLMDVRCQNCNATMRGDGTSAEANAHARGMWNFRAPADKATQA